MGNEIRRLPAVFRIRLHRGRPPQRPRHCRRRRRVPFPEHSRRREGDVELGRAAGHGGRRRLLSAGHVRRRIRRKRRRHLAFRPFRGRKRHTARRHADAHLSRAGNQRSRRRTDQERRKYDLRRRRKSVDARLCALRLRLRLAAKAGRRTRDGLLSAAPSALRAGKDRSGGPASGGDGDDAARHRQGRAYRLRGYAERSGGGQNDGRRPACTLPRHRGPHDGDDDASHRGEREGPDRHAQGAWLPRSEDSAPLRLLRAGHRAGRLSAGRRARLPDRLVHHRPVRDDEHLSGPARVEAGHAGLLHPRRTRLAGLSHADQLPVRQTNAQGHGCGRASSVHAEGRPQKRRRKSSALEPAVFRHALEHPRHTAA